MCSGFERVHKTIAIGEPSSFSGTKPESEEAVDASQADIT